MKLKYKLLLPVLVVNILFLLLIVNILQDEKNTINQIDLNNQIIFNTTIDEYQVTRIETKKSYLKYIFEISAKSAYEKLFEYDKEGLSDPMKKLLQLNSIEAVAVYDSMAKKDFYTLYKLKSSDGRYMMVENKSIPIDILKLKSLSTDLKSQLDNDLIFGKFIIYYNDNTIITQTNQLKKRSLERFKLHKQNVDEQIKERFKSDTIFAVSASLFLLMSIFIMLDILVLKPLSKLETGLNSFFEFLQNKKSHTETINIRSKDEFGKMANSLNDNIEVSGKLHREIKELNQNLEYKVNERTKELLQTKDELEESYKLIKDSIHYASIIQRTIIPKEILFTKYFPEHFTIWDPKDIVGGDIYLVDELNDNECIVSIIDCTGHGVSGAFITMLIKAIEREVVLKILKSDTEVSTANILKDYNAIFQELLSKTHTNNHTGFEAGIFYINKAQKRVHFSGSNGINLFVKSANNPVKTYKGDKTSLGYNHIDAQYQFKEHKITALENDSFYTTTDGFVDQNGGEKGFPFSKVNFKNLIETYYDRAMCEQRDLFIETLLSYQKDYMRTDDITVIGFKL
jgi:serine phosphatase RsbU (regulator of sigma subunit)